MSNGSHTKESNHLLFSQLDTIMRLHLFFIIHMVSGLETEESMGRICEVLSEM